MSLDSRPKSIEKSDIPRERIMALHDVFHRFASSIPTHALNVERVHIDGYDFLRGNNPRDLHINIVKNPHKDDIPAKYGKDGNIFIQVRGDEFGSGGSNLNVSFNGETVLYFHDNSKLRAEFERIGASQEAFEIGGLDVYKCPDENVLSKLESFANMLKPVLKQHQFEGGEFISQDIADNRKNIDTLLDF